MSNECPFKQCGENVKRCYFGELILRAQEIKHGPAVNPECRPGFYEVNACWQEAARQEAEGPPQRMPLLFTRYYPDGSLGKMFSDERTGPADRRGPQPCCGLVEHGPSSRWQYANHDRRSSRGRRKEDN